MCLLHPDAVEGYCSLYEFECYNGQCIHYTFVCDGYYDCDSFRDYSDEVNCEPCSSEYRCSNGYCISYSQRCDVYNDCWDNSDETCSGSSSSSGTSVTGLAVGLCVLVLVIIAVVLFIAFGGSSYRGSRRRRLARTAPLLTIHPPPSPVGVSTAVTHVPTPEQVTVPYPPSSDKDYPPPYSPTASPGETIGVETGKPASVNSTYHHQPPTFYPPPANPRAHTFPADTTYHQPANPPLPGAYIHPGT